MWGECPKDRAVTRLYGSLFACLFQRVTYYGADLYAVTRLFGSLFAFLFQRVTYYGVDVPRPML